MLVHNFYIPIRIPVDIGVSIIMGGVNQSTGVYGILSNKYCSSVKLPPNKIRTGRNRLSCTMKVANRSPLNEVKHALPK